MWCEANVVRALFPISTATHFWILWLIKRSMKPERKKGSQFLCIALQHTSVQHLCTLLSGLAACGSLGTRPGTATPHPPPVPAHSVGRFNGSCATASSLHWLTVPQPGRVGNDGWGQEKNRGKESKISAKTHPPPLTTSVLWIIFSLSPFFSLFLSLSL